MAILHTKTDRGTVIPYTYNEIGERTIQHMDACGWMSTQRGQNCIYNALILNKEQKQTGSIETITQLRQQTQHIQNLHRLMSRITNGKTRKNDNIRLANDTLDTD